MVEDSCRVISERTVKGILEDSINFHFGIKLEGKRHSHSYSTTNKVVTRLRSQVSSFVSCHDLDKDTIWGTEVYGQKRSRSSLKNTQVPFLS